MKTYATRCRGFTLVEIMIVVAIIGLLVAIAVPNFIKSRAHAQKMVCIENLAQIESAKQLWGLENRKKTGDPCSAVDLIGPNLYIKIMPACPAGGEYQFMLIGDPATCEIEGHHL